MCRHRTARVSARRISQWGDGMIEETVKRINELAHKAKAEGLMPEEVEERDRLRKIYIAAVRQNLQAQLEHTYLVDENGEKHPLKKKNQN